MFNENYSFSVFELDEDDVLQSLNSLIGDEKNRKDYYETATKELSTIKKNLNEEMKFFMPHIELKILEAKTIIPIENEFLNVDSIFSRTFFLHRKFSLLFSDIWYLRPEFYLAELNFNLIDSLWDLDSFLEKEAKPFDFFNSVDYSYSHFFIKINRIRSYIELLRLGERKFISNFDKKNFELFLKIFDNEKDVTIIIKRAI